MEALDADFHFYSNSTQSNSGILLLLQASPLAVEGGNSNARAGV